MRRITSMGPGGGSEYSPPRLPPVCHIRSHAAEREACQSENFILFRCPGGVPPLLYTWQRMTQAIVWCSARVLSWYRGAVEAVVGPAHVAWKVCASGGLDCRLPREMVRAGRLNEFYGRPVAVPVFSRRYAGPPVGVREAISGQPASNGGAGGSPLRPKEPLLVPGGDTSSDKSREWRVEGLQGRNSDHDRRQPCLRERLVL
jgi:hypothetical protein